MIFLFFFIFFSKSDFEVDGLTYHIISSEANEVQVVNCSLFSDLLIIPSIVTNENTEYKVTSISSDAFSSSDITQFLTIYFPYTLTDIESSAFTEFSNINMIGYINENNERVNNTLPPLLTKINKDVFSNIKHLTTLDLNKVVEIGPYAFERTIRLTNLKLNVVEIIGPYSLASIQLLQTIELPSTLREIQNFAFSKTSIVNVTGDVSNLEVITTGFKFCSELLNLPKLTGIVEIRNEAFASCTKLKEIHCGSKLEIIYSSACSGCKQLETFTIESTDVFVSPEAFLGCMSLTYFSFNSVVEILNNAFEECTSLRVVDMSECSMDHLNPIFQSCTLSSILLPPNLTDVNADSFFECDVNSITFVGTLEKLDLTRAFYNFKGYLYEVIFAPSCEVDFNNAFVNCPHLSRVVLPKTSYTLDHTFVLCTNLTTVENLRYCTLFNYTFNHCTMLSSIDSLDSLEILGNQSFSNCFKLESLPALPSLHIISSECFLKCTNLKSFECGEKLNEIGSSAFEGCTSLQSVKFTFPPSLISKNAFNSCTALESVIVEKSPTNYVSVYIRERAFENCSALKSFEFDKWPIVLIDQYAFYNCPLSQTIAFAQTPVTASELNISSFAFASSEIRSLDFRFDYTSLNLDKNSFSDCHKINCVMIDKNHKSDVSSLFNNKIINGAHCPNFIKSNLVFLIFVVVGSAVIIIVLIVIIFCLVKRRRGKKMDKVQPLLSTQQNQYQ